MCPEKNHWYKAMLEELKSIKERKVWTLVARPENAKILGCRWVFTLKRNDQGKIERYKARLVAQGYRQVKGETYDEVFSPVVNFSIIRFFFSMLVCLNKWIHIQCDIKGAYLYAPLKEKIFIKQPPGFEDKSDSVCLLNKALYGLHQSGREWYFEINSVLCKMGFEKFKCCNCVYSYKKCVILLLYVDDIVIFGRNHECVDKVIILLQQKFDMKILGKTEKLLGVNFVENNGCLYIHQYDYIKKVSELFKKYSAPISSLPIAKGTVFSKSQGPQSEAEIREMSKIPYRSLIGCLAFISSRTRPDIAYAVNIFSQFQENPGLAHWNGLLKLLGYVSSTRDLRLNLSKIENLNLIAHTDADFASNRDDRTSMGGQIVFLDQVPIAWRAFKQKCISLSSMESEFIALTETAKEIVWFSRILQECKNLVVHRTKRDVVIMVDNQAAISFIKSPVENYRTKHIDVKLFFVRDLVYKNMFKLQYIKSKENMADIFTKPLTKFELKNFKDKVFL